MATKHSAVRILCLVTLFAAASPALAGEFRRGDANGDGAHDISDPVTILGALFLGGAPIPCLKSADVNDDGAADISDPVALLAYLFIGGEAPRPPFPGCGTDPTDDPLACPTQAGCPGGPHGTLVIAADGGTAFSTDGRASVTIPPGALEADTVITVEPAAAVPGELLIAYDFGPDGLKFKLPVTITIAYDPSALPPGVATENLRLRTFQHDVWISAPSNGGDPSLNTVAARTTHFTVYGVGFLGVDRHWEFQQKRFPGGPSESLGGQHYIPSGVLDDSYVFNPPSPVGDDARKADVHSSETGQTWSVAAQSPHAVVVEPGSVIGSTTTFRQKAAWRKVSDDATFRVVISKAYLKATDGNPAIPFGDECPAGRADLCETPISGSIDIDIFMDEVIPESRTVHDYGGLVWDSAEYAHFEPEQDITTHFDLFRPQFAVSGSLGLTGLIGDWNPGAWDEEPNAGSVENPPLWTIDDFEVETTTFNASMTLNHPIVLEPHIDSIPRGGLFVVDIEAWAETSNYRQKESAIDVYLRDPQGGSGVGFVTQGVEQVDMRPVIGERPPPQPAPPCAGAPDPAAGVLEFSTVSYRELESSLRGARVLVNRTGGSLGVVSAKLKTGGGTAGPGVHYTTVELDVGFADGQMGSRLVRIPLLDDDVENPDRTVLLTLSDPGGCAALGTRTTAALTILDNDRTVIDPPPPSYRIGGTVTGLVGAGLAISNGFDGLSPGNGPFTFPTPRLNGTDYQIRVTAQPTNPIQLCTVINGTGTIAGADVTDVEIECAAPEAAGELDPLFDADGRVTTSAVTGVKSLALQGDGKLVAVSSPVAWLTRFNSDGSLDTGFGTDGIVRVKFKTSGETARGVAIQPDGKIVVVGLTFSAGSNDFGVARYLPDGKPDLDFGVGGGVAIDLNGSDDDAYVPLIQPDGKILVAGNGGTSTPLGVDSDFAVVRLTDTGELDGTFGSGGKAWSNIGGRADLVTSAVLQPDGKVLIAGRVGFDGGSLPDAGLARFTAEGDPDTTLGNDVDHLTGTVRQDFAGTGAHDLVTDLTLQSDGKIVLAIEARIDGVYQHALARLTPGGGKDLGFGTGGLAARSFFAGGDYARAVAIQDDGRIVTAGFTRPGTSESDDFLITRHNADGSLDMSFSEDGKLTVDFFALSDGAECVVLQGDGRIVAAGLARNASTNGLAMIRVLP